MTMRPEEIRPGAFYQGDDDSVRFVSSISVSGRNLWWRHPSVGLDYVLPEARSLPSEFAAWAVREVRLSWEPVVPAIPTADAIDEGCPKGVLR